MVRRRVLEVFAGMYAPGGTAIDIDAADAVESTGGSVRTVTRRQSLVERLILWWSTRN
jgi:hypothetical protein